MASARSRDLDQMPEVRDRRLGLSPPSFKPCDEEGVVSRSNLMALTSRAAKSHPVSIP
jgi:hypothetical protein